MKGIKNSFVIARRHKSNRCGSVVCRPRVGIVTPRVNSFSPLCPQQSTAAGAGLPARGAHDGLAAVGLDAAVHVYKNHHPTPQQAQKAAQAVQTSASEASKASNR